MQRHHQESTPEEKIFWASLSDSVKAETVLVWNRDSASASVSARAETVLV